MNYYPTGEPIEEGDRARRKIGSGSCSDCEEGETYEVRKSPNGTGLYLAGKSFPEICCDCFPQWELVSKKGQKNIKLNTMTKLNSMMKRLLDADTKKLIKGGLINGDLQLTEEGKEALLSVVFEEKKVELVKIAEENIAEAEKEKC